MADIRKAAGTEERIHNGVKQHVGIRVAKKASLFRNTDASQDEGPLLVETVYIVALSDAEGAAVFSESLFQTVHIVGGGYLEETLLTGNEPHRYAQLFQHRCIIGEGSATGKKFHRPMEKAC